MALRLTWEAVSQGRPVRDFHSVPTFEFASFDEDVALELELLIAAGIGPVVAVDLIRPEFGIPVVRVVAPHLQYSRRKTVVW
jgi:ribosomal protein S12 methylthiotransferase accessory factor